MKGWLNEMMKEKISEQKVCTKHGGEHHYIPLPQYNNQCPVCFMAEKNGDKNYE